MMRTQIPSFRLPDGYRRGIRLYSRPRHHVFRRQSYRQSEITSGGKLRRHLCRLRRAARQGSRNARTLGSGRQYPYRHQLAGVGLVRPCQQDRQKVIVLGGGNTAMDCCRSSRRLGGEDVKVIVRSPFDEMKASPWEKEDAMHEDIPIYNFLVPKSFILEDGKLKGIMFEKVKAEHDEKGRRNWFRRASRTSIFPATTFWWRSDRKTPFRGSSATSASNSANGTCRWSTKTPFFDPSESLFRRRRGVRPGKYHQGGRARP